MANVFKVKVYRFCDSTNKCYHKKIWGLSNWIPFAHWDLYWNIWIDVTPNCVPVIALWKRHSQPQIGAGVITVREALETPEGREIWCESRGASQSDGIKRWVSEWRHMVRILEKREPEFREGGKWVSQGVEDEAETTCGILGHRNPWRVQGKNCSAYLLL